MKIDHSKKYLTEALGLTMEEADEVMGKVRKLIDENSKWTQVIEEVCKWEEPKKVYALLYIGALIARDAVIGAMVGVMG